jgi:hypothetical protein
LKTADFFSQVKLIGRQKHHFAAVKSYLIPDDPLILHEILGGERRVE